MSAESPKPGEARPTKISGRELGLAAVVALLFFALPVGRGLFDPTEVYYGVDTGGVQLPWSAVLPDAPDGVHRPRNPALWDPGIGFYPLYRWMVERWAKGESVRWNPLLFTGAPALGNPQQGVLDPQNWLLGIGWRLGGEAGFHRMLAASAWLRFVLAGLGAYLLARKLALARGPSALAGLAFGLSGYQVSWLNYALGHVTPFLPWVLLGLEVTRSRRPLFGVLLAALSLALAVLGGHPETAFFVGAAAGVWALALLRTDRRAGLLSLGGLALGCALSAAGWMPFLEYLDASQAQAERELVLTRGGVDLVAVGMLVALVGIVALARRELSRGGSPGTVALRVVGPVVALAAGAWALATRGVDSGIAVQLLHDAFGAPGDGAGGYRGPGVITEVASGWIASAALALAIAAALSSRSPLPRRGLLLTLGGLSLGLCLELPGLVDLWRLVPVVGLGQTARLGSVSALMLALLAADGAAHASRHARASAVALIVLGIASLFARGGPPPLEHAPRTQQDELVGHLCLPPEVLDNRAPYLEGWFAGELEVGKARLVIERLDAGGRVVPGSESSIPFEITPEPSERARRRAPEEVARVPAGARFFHTQSLLVDRFEEGHWLLSVELLGPGEHPRSLGRRIIRSVTVWRPPSARGVTLLLVGIGLALVLLSRPGSRLSALLLVVAVQGLWFARGKNPTVPLAEVYPPTRTVEILRRELGDRRYLAEPGVLPPDTGVLFGLRCVDGYDGLRPYLYNAYKNYALRPGVHQLLGWNARGADLSSGVFRMFGVGALVLQSPIEEEGWDLIASPDPARGVERAETWIYRARDPVPPAFCVNRVVSIEVLAGELEGWDPREVAALEDAWRPAHPFSNAEVSDVVLGAEEVRLHADLDGDGLLVLGEGAFPGWEAEVDGEQRPVLNANMAFRSVVLGAGSHEVVFRYRSEAARNGFAVSSAALVLLALLLLAVRSYSPAGSGGE